MRKQNQGDDGIWGPFFYFSWCSQQFSWTDMQLVMANFPNPPNQPSTTNFGRLHAASRSTSSGCLGTWWNGWDFGWALGSVGTTFTIIHHQTWQCNITKQSLGITQFQQPKTPNFYQNAEGNQLIIASFPPFFSSFCGCGLKGRQPGATSKFNHPTKTEKKTKHQTQELHHHWCIPGVSFGSSPAPKIGWIPNHSFSRKKKSRLCTLGKSFWRRRLTMEEVWNWKSFRGMNCFSFWHLPSFEIEKKQ